MIKNPFKSLNRLDVILYLISLTAVILSNFFGENIDPVNLIGTIVGVTSLILTAKGDVWGQILGVVFSVLYSIVSFRCAYYGEMITYLGMTAPIAVFSVISWIRHPYSEDRNEVRIHTLTSFQRCILPILTISVTFLFYFVLKFFDTANLYISTLSVATSFLASALMFFRSPYYAVAYAANDIVLIVLWVSVTVKDQSYLPMLLCFTTFLINDIYGFTEWKKREKSSRR